MERLIFLHGLHTPRCTSRVNKEFEGYYTLQYSPEGPVEVGYDAESFCLSGAWFWPAFPGPRIRFHAAPGRSSWDHYYIAMRGALAVEWMAEGLFPARPQPCPAGFSPKPIYESIYELAFSPGRLDRLRAIHLLEGMLLELARFRADEGRPDWLIRLLGELDRAESMWPDYAQLAEACGMSLVHLRRLFVAATGQTLHDYVLQLRMSKARDLLAKLEIPIKEVAEHLGYEDVYYFTKQFRQLIGVPPATYRKNFARLRSG